MANDKDEKILETDFSSIEERTAYMLSLGMQVHESLQDNADRIALNVKHKDLYYLHSTERGKHDGLIVWWRPNKAGYTANLAHAGTYTLEQAEQICLDSYGEEEMYLCADVDKEAKLGVAKFIFNEHTKWRDKCEHIWNYEGGVTEYCKKCKMGRAIKVSPVSDKGGKNGG